MYNHFTQSTPEPFIELAPYPPLLNILLIVVFAVLTTMLKEVIFAVANSYALDAGRNWFITPPRFPLVLFVFVTFPGAEGAKRLATLMICASVFVTSKR